jgi:N-carbamoyl-L-amino-acid hydrolase
VQEFSAFGRLPRGGVSRLCASIDDGAARDRLGELLTEYGAELRVDAVGNQFGLFRLHDQGDWEKPAVMMGSHLDSQPRGGRIDGTLGVLAALETGRNLIAARRSGHEFSRDFCVVNWTNEEGARFRPSLLGSGVFAGVHPHDYALNSCDDAGIRLADALEAIGYRGSDTSPPPPACYIELHAEQGPILEKSGFRLGVVTGNWGAAKLDFVFEGEQAHTGPTPMADRRDALLASARAISSVRALADRFPGRAHTSVGRILVSPNSSNVVVDRVELTAEFRSGEDALVVEMERVAHDVVRLDAESARVSVTCSSRSLREAREMPKDVVAFLATCAEALAEPMLRLRTVSGHDAVSLIGHCPTGLVFVPSVGGIAHNEAEETGSSEMDTGARLLAEAAFRLCDSKIAFPFSAPGETKQ